MHGHERKLPVNLLHNLRVHSLHFIRAKQSFRSQVPNKKMSLRNFSLFLALRYLRPKRTFLSIITLISILGVTLGITVLILVIAVMTGFDRELREKVIGFDAHIVIGSQEPIPEWRALAEGALKIDGISAYAPYVQGPVIVEHQNRRMAPKIRGIDAALEQKVTDIRRFMVAGELRLEEDTCVLGSELARELRADVGDIVTVYSPGHLGEILDQINAVEAGEADSQSLRELVLPTELEVVGIFESGRYLYDSEFLLVPLHIGQELYALGDSVHGIALRTQDPYLAERLKQALYPIIDYPLFLATWIDLNRQLFDAIRMERNVMFFLLMFIIVVAAFGIMNTLITVTVQKTRDIGVMKALGARTGQIVWVFLAQGMVVGIFGNFIGLALGMSLVRWRNEVSQWLANVLGIEIFPREVYQFSEIPAQVVPSDVAIICLSAFAVCSLAALIPAWFAARLDPVKALRYE